MSEEKNNEQRHFVVSANAAYGLVLTLTLGGAGGYGVLQGQFPTGQAGQCPNDSQVALSVAERNRQDISDIRNLISQRDTRSYKEAQIISEKEAKQRGRDALQDSRLGLVERLVELNAEVQPNK